MKTDEQRREAERRLLDLPQLCPHSRKPGECWLCDSIRTQQAKDHARAKRETNHAD